MKRFVFACLCFGFVALCIGVPFCVFSGGCNQPNQLPLLAASDKQLSQTQIVPTLDAHIDGTKNVIWCGTFQLAWNEACSLIQGDVRTIPEPEMVKQLNKKRFTKAELDDASYMALAGFVQDGIYGKIRTEAASRFPGATAPQHLPDEKDGLRPQDFVAYSYLFKDLQFASPFQSIEPMTFAGKKVQAFGVESDQDGSRYSSQVTILDYRGPGDFIIELSAKSEDDRIILAMVEPQSTLGKTVDGVWKRLEIDAESASTLPAASYPSVEEAGPQPIRSGDILRVPKFNFDFHRQYRELEGLKVISNNPKVPNDALIVAADQDVRFSMNENGVKLKSESHVGIGCSANRMRHVMVFDKPFLLMMQRADAKMPYFVMWVANPEVMGE